jgi:hypothetical protein
LNKIRSILVLIDRTTLLPVKYTSFFCLDKESHQRVQFLSGIETNENNILLTYGIGNYKTEFYKIPRYRLNYLFKNID